MSVPTEKRTERRKPNYLYSIASVALVLFLIGFFGLILLHAQKLMRTFKENISLMVEMVDEVSTAQIDSLGAFLRARDYVRNESVTFISREEAARIMQEDFGEDFLKLGLPNPFYDVFTFHITAEQMQPDSLQRIRNELKAQYTFVSDVFYQENIVDKVADNMRRVRYFAIAMGIFLLFVAVALIYNTIRLALYANRFLIKNMELVGASWEFISRPYLMQSVVHGLISGTLAVVALILALIWAQTQIPDLKILQDLTNFATLFASLIVLGILINTAGTYFVVKKYLKMRVDDLY